MMIRLIQNSQMYTKTLPDKIKGKYWISDSLGVGIICVEAFDGQWVVQTDGLIDVCDEYGNILPFVRMQIGIYVHIFLKSTNEKGILFLDYNDEQQSCFYKYGIKAQTCIVIGRDISCDICYDNPLVSNIHAKLYCTGTTFQIMDQNSTNGIYVNGLRCMKKTLQVGDCIYIMGLSIIVGKHFIGLNQVANLKYINESLLDYNWKCYIKYANLSQDNNISQVFFRSPHFYEAIIDTTITLDAPPQPFVVERMPLFYTLGPSLTMAMGSLSMMFFSLHHTLINGGNFQVVLPGMILSLSMALTTLLWPIVLRKYEHKQMHIKEAKRQTTYLHYLMEKASLIKQLCEQHRAILYKNYYSNEICIDIVLQCKSSLWERMLAQKDFLLLRLGIGNIDSYIHLQHPQKQFVMEEDQLYQKLYEMDGLVKQLLNVPITCSLMQQPKIGIYGSYQWRLKWVYGLILQMVSLHSYNELKLVLLLDEEVKEDFWFLRFLPHMFNEEKTFRFLASNDIEYSEINAYLTNHLLTSNQSLQDDGAYYVIFVMNKMMMKKCNCISKLLKQNEHKHCSVITFGEQVSDLAKEVKMIVHVEESEIIMEQKQTLQNSRISFKPEFCSRESLEQVVDHLANITLDEQVIHKGFSDQVSFLQLFDVEKVEHLNCLTRWKENDIIHSLQTPIGLDEDQDVIYLDLHEKFHGPHGVVAGMTGSGKSEWIITYILSMAVNYHPYEVSFVLIDYKGGGLADAFWNIREGICLPHVVGTITNLDGSEVQRCLISLESELKRRQILFHQAKELANASTMDIYKYQNLYRKQIVKEAIAHLFIISDEFAELKTQHPEFMEQLIRIARIGRSLGVHLILATQKPAGVVDDQIWCNSRFRVCLKVQDHQDSQEMIQCREAAYLKESGRFYLQVGYNELFLLGQCGWCGERYINYDCGKSQHNAAMQIIDHLGREQVCINPIKQHQQGESMTQIQAVICYITQLSSEEQLSMKPIWMNRLPALIFIDDLESKYARISQELSTQLCVLIGEYDDPYLQRHVPLYLSFSKQGHCVIFGLAGSGKTSFITTLLYALLKHYSIVSLGIYIIDCSLQTLFVFKDAPSVIDVFGSDDEIKWLQMINHLQQVLQQRKQLFQQYGGTYQSYCEYSGKALKQYVVIIHNYASFCECYDEDELYTIIREGENYGIYFVLSACMVSDIRYRVLQSFKMIYMLAMSDYSEYTMMFNTSEHVILSKGLGRGLFCSDHVYEFQIASICEGNEYAYLKEFVKSLGGNNYDE